MARFAIHQCLAGAWLLSAMGCSSGGMAATLSYPDEAAAARAGEAFSVSPVYSGPDASFEVTPPLPAGLALDVATGAVAGTPTGAAAALDYTVTATFAGGEVRATLRLVVGTPLPAPFATLAAGFEAEVVVSGRPLLGKVAHARDGRAFFAEVTTGAVRVVDADGQLLGPAFVTLPVVTGGHLGLLGLSVREGFGDGVELFVSFCMPGDPGAGRPDTMQVRRFGADANVAPDQGVVILSDLPVSAINNSGALAVLDDGTLLVSLGDHEDPAAAQVANGVSGRLLRVERDGAIPADNPDPQSRDFAIGLRNTWALGVHRRTGGVFAADNGPATDDELNFVQAGKNYGWGATAPIPGAEVGFRMRAWPDVVVPTGLGFQETGAFGARYRDVLFLGTYHDNEVLAVFLSGSALTDIDREEVFLALDEQVGTEKPIDLAFAADGSLWLVTVDSIYRIARLR